MEHQHHMDHIHQLMGISILELGGFVAILSYSFFASLHCTFMCGPLVCGVFGGSTQFKKSAIWIYNIFRVTSYVAIGALLGYVSFQLEGVFSFLGGGIGIAMGIILFIFAVKKLFPLPLWLKSKWGQGSSRPLVFLNKLNSQIPTKYQPAGLGFVTAFFPCMTLTPAYAMAAGAGDGLSGAVFMLGFGVGTLPVMLSAPLLTRLTLSASTQKVTNIISGMFLLIASFITIWHGLMS